MNSDKRTPVHIHKNIDLGRLLEDLPAETRAGRTNREIISAAVTNYLNSTVQALAELGFEPNSAPRQRPRPIDLEVWSALEEAEQTTGIAKAVLLRACLTQLGRDGIKNIE